MALEEPSEVPVTLSREDAVPSLLPDDVTGLVSNEDDSPVKPPLAIRRHRLLPDDLVDSDTASEGSESCARPENEYLNEITSPEASSENKVGRWTYSKGGSRKPRTSVASKLVREVKSQKNSASAKLENIELHQESQRLLREANIELIEHRPKQFTRFSEFRRLLHENSSNDSPSASITTEILQPPITSGHYCECDAPAIEQVETTGLDSLNGDFHAVPTTTIPITAPVSKVSQLLPAVLPPVARLDQLTEDVIDLGEALPSQVPRTMTPADLLLARFKKHLRTPTLTSKREPIEYQVLTKVMDENNGGEHLRVETVSYESEKAAEMMTGSQRRERWRQHRELLREQMRQRRLEQYEARLKEVEHNVQTTEEVADQALSDDDYEWSEGEVSSEETSSTSSTTDSEDESEEDDMDDDVVVPSRRPRTCAFADDEAEESGNEDEADAYLLEHEDVGEFESDESQSRSSVFRSTTAKYSALVTTLGHNSVGERLHVPQQSGLTALAHSFQMDEFTDFPTTSQEPPGNSGPADDFCFADVRRPQGSLGPGDVDLFMSDYSTALDRPLNIPSVLTSTRLDTTVLPDNPKMPVPHVASETQSYSQWTNTPYELLFSQRPINQSASLSKESSTLTTDNAEQQVNASQDTVLLSQVSDADVPFRAPSLSASTFQESQEEHAKRRQLFGTLSSSTDCLDVDFFDIDAPSDTVAVEPYSHVLESSHPFPSVSPKHAPSNSPSAQQLETDASKPSLFSVPASSPSSPLTTEFPLANLHLPLEISSKCCDVDSSSVPESASLPSVDSLPLLTSVEPDNKPVRRHRLIVEDDENDSLLSWPKGMPEQLNKLESQEIGIIQAEPDACIQQPPSNSGIPENLETSCEPDEDEASVESDGSEEVERESSCDSQSVGLESDEEEAQRIEILGDKPKTRKVFQMGNFLDEEAELSGDENERAYYRDGDDDYIDSENDELDDLELVDDENLPSAGRLRRQVERVHHRLQADQDQREIRILKELYFEDGDLHAENGKTRERRFRWRGLENDDQLVYSFGDVDDDQSSDGADNGVDTSFGPMDRWLRGGLAQHSHSEEARPVDLDRSQGSETNASDGAVDTALNCSVDEEKGNADNTENSVLSLGRKAILKAKTQETQFLVLSVNKKVVSQPKQAKNSKASTLVRASTLTSFFQKNSESTVDANKNPTSVALSSAFLQDSTTPSAISSENKLKIPKRGSLLGRIPLLMRCGSSQLTSDTGDTDPIVSMDEDSLSGSSHSSFRQSQVQFLGLRNKVGMSCFSVLSQPVSCADQPSSQSKLLNGPSLSGKRPSADLIPPNIKRQRSASVFSALS